MTNTDLAALSEALAHATKHCPNAPYVAVKREIVERLVSGDLVLIDREGMRERVAEAVWNCSFHPDDLASGEAQRRIAEWPADYAQAQKRADAAIAAMMGGEHE